MSVNAIAFGCLLFFAWYTAKAAFNGSSGCFAECGGWACSCLLISHWAAVARLLEVFSKWTPSGDTTFHQFVAGPTGRGLAVTESDDPASAARDAAKFAPFFEYTVYPVLDVADAVAIMAEGAEWRKSIT